MEQQQLLQEYGAGADHKPHKWEKFGGTRQRIGLERDRRHRYSREKLKRHRYLITHPVNQTPYTQKFGGTSQSSLPDMKLVSTTFVGVSGLAQTTIGFDELGTPLTCNPLLVTETLSSGSILIQAGTYKLKVDIEPYTGQISVNPG